MATKKAGLEQQVLRYDLRRAELTCILTSEESRLLCLWCTLRTRVTPVLVSRCIVHFLRSTISQAA